MSAPTGTTLAERTERALGLGEPKPPSRHGLAFFCLLAAIFVGVFVWYALAGGWEGSESLSMAGSAFLWLYLLSDRLGAFLYARRGTSWGRGLRAFGSAAFFPLSMGFYLVSSWTTSTFLFVVLSAIFGIWVLWTAFCLLRLAWGRE